MIPLLISLAPFVVRAVEGLSKGTKLQTAVAAIRPIADNLAAAGIGGEAAPNETALASIMEVVVQDLKRRGELGGPAPAQAAGSVIQAKAGDQITLTIVLR